MRLSTQAHGFADLVLGAVLIAAPWVFGFGAAGPAGWVAIVIGAVVIATALITDFEIGRFRRMPIAVHLWADTIAGVVLAVSPWLLEFDRTAWIPHVVIGVLLVLVAFVTRTVPGYDRRRSGAAPAR